MFEKLPVKTRIATGAFAGLVAVSACGTVKTGNFKTVTPLSGMDAYLSHGPHNEQPAIKKGAKIRYDPAVLEPGDGASNVCATVTQTTPLPDQFVFTYKNFNDDPNGVFVGFKEQALADAGLGCSGDLDKVAWVQIDSLQGQVKSNSRE